MVKVAVFVSGGGTNLQALIDASERGEMPHAELSLVLSSHADAYALERAAGAGIESVVVPRGKLDRLEFSENILRTLAGRGIGLIVLAGFKYILHDCFWTEWRDKVINVHPSLIPSFCGDGFYGLRVHKAVLDYGVKLSGATVHFVNEITDGGRIIAQRAVEILPDDTPESLQRRVMEQAEWVILPQAVETVCRQWEADACLDNR